ncbi:dolichol kinase-like [Pollicipes pollicipes]|uniref:dolichol kinase-like n=1 Tax=Pollicipes pollicipes TaxID=41117 RepID=UPI0018855CDF|nr:dolichol kinase-like [Pollicipes pollicipes]
MRVRLLTWWTSLLVGALLFATVLGACSGAASPSGRQSILRKPFHLLVCVVFVPGLLHDPALLLAASGGLTFLFIVAEVARACGVQPWSRILQAWCQPFLDSKDTGALILPNIYLLVACSGVLWYHAESVGPVGRYQDLCLFAGVITIGVGDTVAAVVGSSLGRWRWPRSVKTVEGSLASAAAQLLFCFLLDYSGHLEVVPEAWWPLCVSVCVTTLAEAFTNQADNLVLPPLFVVAFKMAAVRWW